MLKHIGAIAQNLAEQAVDSGLTPAELADEVKKRALSIWLDLNGGSQVRTAERLGIHRNTLRLSMNRYGLKAKGYTASRGNRGEIL